MSYEEEIKHLSRVLMDAKTNHLNSEDMLMKYAFKSDIETLEFQIDVFKKAAAFGEVLKSYDNAPTYSEIGEDVINIVNKYRGSGESDDE